jgi:hypothetical protein
LNSKNQDEDCVDKRVFMKNIMKQGILKDDPRIKDIIEQFESFDDVNLDKS